MAPSCASPGCAGRHPESRRANAANTTALGMQLQLTATAHSSDF